MKNEISTKLQLPFLEGKSCLIFQLNMSIKAFLKFYVWCMSLECLHILTEFDTGSEFYRYVFSGRSGYPLLSGAMVFCLHIVI